MYYGSRQMLILSGDHLYRMNYRDLIARHRETDADITICVYPVPIEDAPRMGLLRAKADGRVTEFMEKPQDPDVIKRFKAPRAIFAQQGLSIGKDLCLANMGIYVFEPYVLREVLEDEEKTDFGKEVIPTAIPQYKVMAYPFNDYWMDIGTIGAFFDANISLTRPEPPYRLYEGGWPLYTRSRSLPPSRVIGSEIVDSILVEGTEIHGAHVANSIIGTRSNVRAGAVLRDVILMGQDFYEGEQLQGGQPLASADAPPMGIGRDCRIERAIIDKNARIGDGVVIPSHLGEENFQNEYCWVRDGVAVVPKGTVIPAGTEL
jgi:glucose-1-phosphate adenylyltransferase